MIQTINQTDDFSKYLIRACLSHMGIGVIIALTSYALDLDIFKVEPAKKDIKVIESAVRVDVVAMPKFTVQELKKMDLSDTTPVETPQEKPSESKETSDIEFKKIGKKLNLSNLLNNLSKNEVVKKKNKEKKKKIDNNELKKLVKLGGNIVNEGTSTVGSGQIYADEEFVSYIQTLPDRVRPNWKLPSYLLEKELRCRLQVFLAANGKVLRIVIHESSGDAEYDQKAVEAVRASSPLPAPERTILARVTAGDVILGFPL